MFRSATAPSGTDIDCIFDSLYVRRGSQSALVSAAKDTALVKKGEISRQDRSEYCNHTKVEREGALAAGAT